MPGLLSQSMGGEGPCVVLVLCSHCRQLRNNSNWWVSGGLWDQDWCAVNVARPLAINGGAQVAGALGNAVWDSWAKCLPQVGAGVREIGVEFVEFGTNT